MFSSILRPAANRVLGPNWGLGNYGGCGLGIVALALQAESEGCSAARGPGTLGETSSTFTCQALPSAAARRIPELGGVVARSKWRETASNAPQAAHGVQALDLAVAGSGLVAVNPGSFAFVSDTIIDQSPEGGGRPWVVTDWDGSANSHALIITTQEPADNSIECDQAFVTVSWERDPQGSILEILAPYVPLASILGGLAHARVATRALERWVARATRGYIAWEPCEDEPVLRALRAHTWPRFFDLAGEWAYPPLRPAIGVLPPG